MIVGVAIRSNEGHLYALMRPARHCNFSAKYNEMSRKKGWPFPWVGWDASIMRFSRGEQGFITNEGKFLDREEAARHAYFHGQVSRLKLALFSEDLW